MFSMPPLPRLGDLELAILEHLWDSQESDVIQAHARIGAQRGISPNTVGSALERLYKKGLATRDKVSHAYRYRPTLDRDAFQAQKIFEAAGTLESLSKDGVLAAFVDLVADADHTALEQLERLVRQRKERP